MKKQHAAYMMNAEPKAGSSIADILTLANSYAERKEYHAARILFDRAAASCRGMIEYARFLLTVPQLDNFDKNECMRKAKEMLLYVEKNGSNAEMRDACLMLANLYRQTKEIRALGFLMRANRLGGVEESDLQCQLLKRIGKMEVAAVENDPYGCYIAGVECSQYPYDPQLLKWALYFLEMTIENGQSALAGVAAMRMADVYGDYYRDEKKRAQYMEIAERNGNPEILTKS